MAGLKKRGIWCGPGGNTQDAVNDHTGRLKKAGFNVMLPAMKHGDGKIAWQSDRFPDISRDDLNGFDAAAALVNAKEIHGMEMHAWFIDYYEHVAFDEHPEWAMRDATGRTTGEEQLRGQRFTAEWMCPAQRPGYTDQRLVPLYEDFAQRYAFDAVHHDYIRYPGDLAPDQYCFCDSCLEQIPKWANLRWEKWPDRRFLHDTYDREYLEAHWEPTPTALPENWDRLPRHMKAHFLLEGCFFEGGRADMDHFFYEFRMHWITQFAKESAEAVRAARPGMKISQAVFKNPIHSGRFIGQDWTRFSDHVDSCMPMNYRDHFPGDFEIYLKALEEIIIRQRDDWAANYEELLSGMAINFLYYEVEEPLCALAAAAELGDPAAAAAFWPLIIEPIMKHEPALASEIAKWIDSAAPSLESSMKSVRWYRSHFNTGEVLDPQAAPESVKSGLAGLMKRPPAGFYPTSRIERLIDMVADCNIDGLVFFCDGHLDKYSLWDTVEAKFAQH